MADDVRITNLPDSGSPERVAYDLCMNIMHYYPASKGKERAALLLNIYAACMRTVRTENVDVSKLT